jgi:alpha-beta hydrolase superfamily lysophospholipase
MDDIAQSLEAAAQRYPGKPRFLYGHSLGGLLAINFALRRKPQIAGVVATSPALRTAVEKQAAKIWMARILGVLLPTLSMNTALDANGLSHDPEVLKRYQQDPLVHSLATLRMAKGSIESIPWVFAHAAEFPLPLLLMHGTQDSITYADGSRDFAARIPKNCTLKLWEGLYHETHNEPQKEQVLGFMLAWLNERLLLPLS